MKLTEILRDSNYKLTQFTPEQIEKLEKSIFLKEVRGKEVSIINTKKQNKKCHFTPKNLKKP